MKAATCTGASLPETLTDRHLLVKLGGSQFLVRVLSSNPETIRITFPGSDNPLEDTWLRLELHEDDSVTSFRTRVIEGARSRDEGLLLEYPTSCSRRLHRDAFRVPTDLVAQVRDRNHERRYSADVVNLSSGGALLQMDAPITPESVVAMLLNIPRQPQCHLVGQVVHTRRRQAAPLSVKGLYGVRFIDPNLPTRESLSHYVGERLRHLSSVD